jgi:hypothetical protein
VELVVQYLRLWSDLAGDVPNHYHKAVKQPDVAWHALLYFYLISLTFLQPISKSEGVVFPDLSPQDYEGKMGRTYSQSCCYLHSSHEWAQEQPLERPQIVLKQLLALAVALHKYLLQVPLDLEVTYLSYGSFAY